jgi:hypothetical protein
MAQLKVENLTQTTFRFSPVSFRAPRLHQWKKTLKNANYYLDTKIKFYWDTSWQQKFYRCIVMLLIGTACFRNSK